MKLVIAAALLTLLAMPSIAAAEDGLHPPGGPVYDEPLPQRDRQQPQRGRGRGPLKRALIAKFDANGDGRLQPQERKRAKRAIRARMMKRFIRRFDTNGDGNVGPDEVPRGAARKLRGLDRDRDGWVEPNERRR
jgi:hypothetical protein